jgi:SAM-dependent methyltransferase
MQTLPVTHDLGLDDLLDDIPPGLFGLQFRETCQRLDRFIGALLAETATELALPSSIGPDLGALLARRGWIEAGRLPLRCLLEALEEYGMAALDERGWTLAVVPAPRSSAELRAEAEALQPTTRPSFEVMALACRSLPAVLRGELKGEDALFGPATLGLWFDYFSNSNPLYAPSNHLTALAVARVLPASGSILELGGGAGSAAQATLQAATTAGKPPVRYLFTELQPAFLRRGTRTAREAAPAGCEVLAKMVDINRTPRDQGLEGERFDVVHAVNTLHLARELVLTLSWLKALLKPGGSLVLGELVRPQHRPGVHLELPFSLLETYREVALDAELRPRPGFLTVRQWRANLLKAGFASVEVLPREIERCVQRYPGFYGAAITARA